MTLGEFFDNVPLIGIILITYGIVMVFIGPIMALVKVIKKTGKMARTKEWELEDPLHKTFQYVEDNKWRKHATTGTIDPVTGSSMIVVKNVAGKIIVGVSAIAWIIKFILIINHKANDWCDFMFVYLMLIGIIPLNYLWCDKYEEVLPVWLKLTCSVAWLATLYHNFFCNDIGRFFTATGILVGVCLISFLAWFLIRKRTTDD